MPPNHASKNAHDPLRTALEERILLLDGAYGTLLQNLDLEEEDYRNDRLVDHPVPLKGNYDVLCLTQPDIVANGHRQYLQAGADIIKTNSFTASPIAQKDYQLEDLSIEMNAAAARIARSCVDEFTDGGRQKFVAGVMGPTNRTASISPDVNNPGFRNVSFEELADLKEQLLSRSL